MDNSQNIQRARKSVVKALNAAQWSQAKSILSQIIQTDELDHKLWYQLGYCHLMENNTNEAIRCLHRCVSIQPEFEQGYIILSHAQIRENDVVAAIATLRQLTDLFPKSAEGYRLLAGAYMQNMQSLEAECFFLKSLSINPGQNNARLHLGLVQTNLRKYESAINHLKIVLNSGEFTGEAHNYLGNAYQSSKDFDQAILHYQSAIEKMPHASDPVVNLGCIYEKTHRLEEAMILAEKVLKIEKNNFDANLLAGKIEKRNKNYIKARMHLENCLSGKLEHPNYSIATSEMAHILDKLELYDEAFDEYTKANKAWLDVLQMASVNLDEYIQNIRHYQQWFSSSNVNPSWDKSIEDGIADPIFFVGFPRSGTTLMERILETHPDLISTHEEPLINNLKKSLSSILGRAVELPRSLSELSNDEILKLRMHYFNSAKEAVGLDVERKRLIDKLPLNIVELGLINRLFPEANVIVAIRDPRDSCLSCYMQSFDINKATAHFLSMEKTTELYAEVMKLYQIYKDNLGVSIMEYRYEDLIDDIATVAGKVFNFIAAEWDDKVLEYYNHANNGYVNTPSYQAVTQPIYADAIARWKKYEKHISPYNNRLNTFIVNYGYNEY
jgi:tetratricopeptide (TPR) repeat protein